MVNPPDLIRIALYLASGDLNDRVGRPRQTELSRAVSCAYYALFHTLARCCADTRVGVSPASRSQGAWRQTYRALEHGPARSRCSRQIMLNRFPEEIQDFGRLFVGMQRGRHAADYDPDARFSRSDVLQFIEEAAGTITRFNRVAIRDRRAFAVYVLFSLRQD
ncbi:MAG: hypothetical protein OXC95_09375 [Dehalococcoidia bacterium]|nr:hypothetical protein [Dehalococcoidia bacterium]